MPTFVFTNKNTPELETTIFASEAGDSVIIFTDEQNAKNYLSDAGWEQEMVVAALGPIQLIEWLLHCHHRGVKLLATNPRRAEHEAGLRVNTLNIEAQLMHAGDHIFQIACPDF
jgi:hypothetical protein